MQILKIAPRIGSYIAIIALGLGVNPLPLLAADALDVALPSNVTINFKDGNQSSGVRLVEINSQSIKFAKGGNTWSKDLNQVKSILFEGNFELKARNTVVRGETLKGCSEQKLTVPVNHFKVESKTQAEMNLSSLPTTRRREISQTSQVRGFVVKQLQFDGKGAINVLAAACASE